MIKPLQLIDRAFLLKRTRLFGSIDLDVLLTIAEKMELLSYKKGERIFQIDQEGQQMYVIAEGRVLIKDRHQNLLSELTSGEYFGDESILGEKPRTYEAYSETVTLLLALNRSHLLSILSECPSVALDLLEAYAAKIDFRLR